MCKPFLNDLQSARMLRPSPSTPLRSGTRFELLPSRPQSPVPDAGAFWLAHVSDARALDILNKVIRMESRQVPPLRALANVGG